eukprot:3776044-Rhodomonas_salina.1
MRSRTCGAACRIRDILAPEVFVSYSCGHTVEQEAARTRGGAQHTEDGLDAAAARGAPPPRPHIISSSSHHII